MRKRRSDRNHIIYQITNKVNGEFYIGLTAVAGRAYKKSLTNRWRKHTSRSKNESFDWNIYQSIRSFGTTQFEIRPLEIIRGKSEAHRREIELIKQLKPRLNSTHNKFTCEL
jgi:hypothetical protein